MTMSVLIHFVPSSLLCLFVSHLLEEAVYSKGAAKPGKFVLAGIRRVYMGENLEGIKTSRVVTGRITDTGIFF